MEFFMSFDSYGGEPPLSLDQLPAHAHAPAGGGEGMARLFSLSMGALADDIEAQLHQQGLTLSSLADVDRIQRWANEISSLGIHGLLTEAERDRAGKRLIEKIRPLVRPLPALPTPIENV